MNIGGRYQIVGELGRGSWGVVYRAHDREAGIDVALKMLSNVEPTAILRFKQEFRALADVSHPNLVSLYELFSSEDSWFFTMELVEGVDFLHHVRGEAAAGAVVEATASRRGAIDGVSETVSIPRGRKPEAATPAQTTPAQIERLRGAMVQLVDGVDALHRARRLHRDIKPSNLMVASDGRVVILDFGIVTTFAEQATPGGTVNLLGTPAYMAPEQATGQPLDEASDWYAVGVVLYEALTGIRPFSGTAEMVLAQKREVEPLSPSDLGLRVPPALERVCMRLLARDPHRRAGADELRRALGVRAMAVSSAAVAEPDDLVVGRERELRTMRETLARARAEGAQTVYLHGTSGMGKSSLLREFLDEVRAGGETLVLEGRCFERESVPYKAFDSVVDALIRNLSTLPEKELWEILPEGARDLARLFPVLRRLDAVRASAALTSGPSDPRGVRRRAFGALRSLLHALATRRPVVVAIDDLQWGDTDSALLLTEILRAPDAPPLLTVLSYRSEERDNSPFLATLFAHERDSTEIVVDRLESDQAVELAAQLLARAGVADADRLASVIARESRGNPLFLRELVRYVSESRESGRPELGSLSVDDMLEARFERLEPPALRLLQALAVAGRPLTQGVARSAAELGSSARSVMADLRATKLVRTRGMRDVDMIEPYHDRIREVTIALMDGEVLREHHLRLVRALEREGQPDPEQLAAHLEAAGEIERAAVEYERAGHIATEALAFDQAAAQYARALELAPPSGADAAVAWSRLGDALAVCGRGPEAAEAYLRGVEFADAGGRLDFQRLAAEQLLHSGHLDEGVRLLDAVLTELGISVPSTPTRVLLSLLLRRVLIRIRGLRYRLRDESQVSREDLMRIDVGWSAAVGFGYSDNLRGADFQSRHLLDALRSGEGRRVTRALTAEAAYLALESERSARRAAVIAERAVELADSIGDAEAIAYSRATSAVVTYLLGRWRESLEQAERAKETIRARGGGSSWAMSFLQLQHLWALFQLGEVDQLAAIVPQLLEDARERGDRYTQANMTTGLPNAAWLVRGEPETARHLAATALDRWSPHGVHFQHYWQALALTHCDLYEGKGDDAVRRLDEAWSTLEKGFMLRTRMIRIELHSLRGRARLLAGASHRGRERRRLLRRAWRDARRLSREGMPGCIGQAELVRAGVSVARGRLERADEHYRRALDDFEEYDMSLHAAVTRRRRAELAGRSEEIREIDAWMRERSIRAPARIAAMLAGEVHAPDAPDGVGSA